MGFPGSILAFGMGKVWIGIGLAIGTAANWIFVAKRLRRFSRASLPDALTRVVGAVNIISLAVVIYRTVHLLEAEKHGKNGKNTER